MKKEIVVGIFFCLAGICFACFFGNANLAASGFLDVYHLQMFAQTSPEIPSLFFNILWERLKIFLLLLLFSQTRIRKVMPLCILCFLCFTGGAYLAACVYHLGLLGVLFVAASVFPHGILYFFVLLLIFSGGTARQYVHQKPLGQTIFFYLGMLLLLLLGCILETVVGCPLLRWVCHLL